MSKAIVKLNATPTTLARAHKMLNSGLADFANYISQDLTPPDLIAAYGSVKDTEEIVKDLTNNLRNRTLAELQHSGSIVTEKGTMRMEVGNVCIEARPQKTGYDPKRIEALLRAKGLSVDTYMNQTITYSVDEGKLGMATGLGILNPDEIELCKYEISYALQRPKVIENE